MSTEPREKNESKITPPHDDRRGEPEPGFAGEGDRSELSDGAPLPEGERARIAERNEKAPPSR